MRRFVRWGLLSIVLVMTMISPASANGSSVEFDTPQSIAVKMAWLNNSASVQYTAKGCFGPVVLDYSPTSYAKSTARVCVFAKPDPNGGLIPYVAAAAHFWCRVTATDELTKLCRWRSDIDLIGYPSGDTVVHGSYYSGDGVWDDDTGTIVTSYFPIPCGGEWAAKTLVNDHYTRWKTTGYPVDGPNNLSSYTVTSCP